MWLLPKARNMSEKRPHPTLTRGTLYAPNRRMALTSRSSSGDLYTGSMYDPATTKTVTIGSIFVPAYSGHPSTSVYFYE